MSGTVTIQYTNATLTANVANIDVSGGGTYMLAQNNALDLNGTFTFSGLRITSGAISFQNTSTGVAINGTVTVQVDCPVGDPTITASNFSGSATVQWPSSGSGFETLTPGQPITLSSFQN